MLVLLGFFLVLDDEAPLTDPLFVLLEPGLLDDFFLLGDDDDGDDEKDDSTLAVSLVSVNRLLAVMGTLFSVCEVTWVMVTSAIRVSSSIV